LWIADFAPAKDPAWAGRHLGWLSSSERARFERIHRPDRRAQLLAGHVLLRQLLAALAGVAAHSVAIVSDSDGRPIVEAPAGWCASLAHSGRWVIALVETGGAAAPGVDIELHKPRRDIRAIVRAACGIDARSPEQAYLVWAQREAELKAGRRVADVWVATWDGHAMAACSSAPPDAALAELDGDGALRVLDIAWARRARLPASAWNP
jgi:hypothetical protein